MSSSGDYVNIKFECKLVKVKNLRCSLMGRLVPSKSHVRVSPAQDLADAAVTDPQLSGDVTGSDSLMRELHDSLAHDVR